MLDGACQALSPLPRFVDRVGFRWVPVASASDVAASSIALMRLCDIVA